MNGHANSQCLKEKLQEVQRDRKELGEELRSDLLEVTK